jgi:hypothetical protein
VLRLSGVKIVDRIRLERIGRIVGSYGITRLQMWLDWGLLEKLSRDSIVDI